MRNLKFYITFICYFFLICFIVSMINYCIKSERKIKELELKTQTQQITIETNNELLEKQKIILKQNQQLQKKIQLLENKQKQQRQQIKKTLKNASTIQKKQILLNSLFDEL